MLAGASGRHCGFVKRVRRRMIHPDLARNLLTIAARDLDDVCELLTAQWRFRNLLVASDRPARAWARSEVEAELAGAVKSGEVVECPGGFLLETPERLAAKRNPQRSLFEV